MEEDNTIVVAIGENVVVQENVKVTIDCIKLIDRLKEKGEENPTVTWSKNERPITSNLSQTNVFISYDNRYCIISATQLAVGVQLGTAGNYTCRVCSRSIISCEQNTSSQTACGK